MSNEALGGIRRGLSHAGGLRRRILLWFLVLSLVPLFLSNTVGYLVTRRIIESQVRRYLIALTQVEAQHVAAAVERNQLYLEAVVAGNQFLAASVRPVATAVATGRQQAEIVAALHEHLDRKLGDLRPLAELFVIDTAGVVVAGTRHGRIGTDWSGTELFRAGRLGRFFAEDWETVASRLRPVYRLATPIRDAQGGWVGMLAGSVDLQGLQAFLRIPTHLAGDIHMFIVDGSGHPLVVSHAHDPVDYSTPLRSPFADQPADTVAEYVNYEGVEVLGASVPIPGLPWRYIAEVGVTSAFGQLRTLALLAAALEAAFALLLVTVVWIVARSIVAPLRRLVAGAERIRRGELGVEVQIDRDDELGELGRTFNQMSTELRTSARQIQELHDHEMRRAAQLASVGELASGIAHEIKNPLVGVASGVDLLAKQLERDTKTDGILSQIRSQLERIQSAIRDLLSYARPKELRLVWANPQQLVDRVSQLVRPQADAAGVRISTRVAQGIPQIHVDPELMTQALVNLALNGIQAMGPGGVLEIYAECGADDARILVRDSGPGIPENQLGMIFRPFYTTKHRGTGLGLTITRGIVERHGGRLEVESEPGGGSVFTLVFPTEEQEAVAR